MTTAKITSKTGYTCAPTGARVDHFAFGAVVSGQVAEWALAHGAASRMFDPRDDAKVVGPDEVKAAPKKRGRPRNTKGIN